MYFLNKKGLNLDKIINEMNNYNIENIENNSLNSSMNENNKNTISLTSIKFPDKVKMKSNIKNFEKIPLMDFSEVPCYEPSDDEEEDESNFSEIINNYIPYQFYLGDNNHFFHCNNNQNYFTGIKINPFQQKNIQQIQFEKNK